MKDCRFLEVRRRPAGRQTYYCGMGVNFYSVGENRRLCRTCPLNDPGDVPLCEHLEAYTLLSSDAGGQEFIRVEFDCGLLREPVDDLNVCRICLHYQRERVHRGLVSLKPALQNA